MKTKEAIEFLEWFKDSFYEGELRYSQANQIIELLQRGEKFEAMWESLKGGLDIPKLNLTVNGEDIYGAMKEFEQKYFPNYSYGNTEKR